MTVSELSRELINIINEGHGKSEVYTRNGASGRCDEMGYPQICSLHMDDDDMLEYYKEEGPYDVKEDEVWVEIYNGN